MVYSQFIKYKYNSLFFKVTKELLLKQYYALSNKIKKIIIMKHILTYILKIVVENLHKTVHISK